MKLYVWEDVLCDYSCGMAFAIAESKEDAIKAISKREGYDMAHHFYSDPKVYKLDRKRSIGFCVWGGG